MRASIGMKALFEKMRSDLRDFPTTARYRNLKSTYWNNPKLIQRDVKPLWNLSRSSIRWNWELDTEEQARCHLIEGVETLTLLRKMYRTEAYVWPRSFKEMDADKALTVVNQWLEGLTLSPPVIVYRQEDNTWGKRDGFHRMAIALMCNPVKLPVWVIDSTDGLID